MGFKRKAMGSEVYDYPVELVWKSIAGKSDVTIDPLDEDTYNSREPDRNTVFTRAIEVRQNEFFSFQIKSQMFFANWEISLEPISACRTRVTVKDTVEFRKTAAVLLTGFGSSIRHEIRYFLKDLGGKLKQYDKK